MSTLGSSFGEFRKIFNGKILFLSLLLLVLGLTANFFSPQRVVDKKIVAVPSGESDQQVLGRNIQAPQIYIYGEGSQYVGGGMIAQASTDEPAVYVSYMGGSQNTGGSVPVEIAVYGANKDYVLNYLIHDKDFKQTQSAPDVSQLQYVDTITGSVNSGTYEGTKITLPLAETGVWFLKVRVNSIQANAYVVRSNIGVLTEEGDNEFIFWGQNFKTKRSVDSGDIKIFNLQEGINEIGSTSFGSDGIATTTIGAESDIAMVQQGDDVAIVPINLKYLNVGFNYRPFQPKVNRTKYFIFTDRPLYKPGDTVYFKAVLRTDDDARYTVPGGEASVEVYDDYYYEGSDLQPIFKRNYPISQDGAINGEYKVPADGKIGYQTLAVKVPDQSTNRNFWDNEWTTNTTSYNVEYYKKPEFSMDVTVPKTELIAGDKTKFKISGTYFSGQPLIGQKVKYTVYSSDFYEYQYLTDQSSYFRSLNDDYRYGSWYGSHKVAEGSANLDKKGEVEFELDSKMDFNEGKSQVFSIEAALDDGSQTPSFTRKNVLVYAGEYGIYRKDSSYGSKVDTPLELPVALRTYRDGPSVGGINLAAKIHRENWVKVEDDTQKYPKYVKEEEDLPEIKAKTDGDGNATFSFTPSKVGSYTITVEGKDVRGNFIAKKFYSYVSKDGEAYYSTDGSNDLSISADKQTYLPSDTARFSIYSSIPDRDVFLALERGRVQRFEIVHLNGKNGQFDIPLTTTDIPNVYAKVASFSDYALDSSTTEVPVSADSKKLVVSINPDAKTFGPGGTINIDISTTDISGNPLSADVALWAVDKAIFELSDTKLGDIFDTFWHKRSNTTQSAHSLEGILVNQAEGGGCFAQGTSVLMADGSYKDIEDVKTGNYVLTRTERDGQLIKAKVLSTHKAEVDGYTILNRSLKVTANHIMWVNGGWKEAGSVAIGDTLVNDRGEYIKVTSVEWQRGKFDVYNLEVEKYHTYFAGGIWVHNQKGDVRQAFKDTAYWNPSIRTDSSGKARVTFKLPDNLTTWTIAAVGSTKDTKVGQTTGEVIVTKDVIVRPILPNIMRTGDEIVLSALVQNFTQNEQKFDIDMTFDAGKVEKPSNPDVVIGSNDIHQFYWKALPDKENEKAKLTFSAKSKSDAKASDIIEQVIPVRAFGFMEKRAETGDDAKTYQLKLASDSSKEKSSVTLSLAPSIVGTLPAAMKYLIDYPYGCVEQTTSRFVPAVIAKLNQSLFSEALKDNDINAIIEKSVSKLESSQNFDDGWAWWSSGNSDPFVTAYVIEYLLQARKAGTKVNQSVLDRAQSYLSRDTYVDPRNPGQNTNYTKEAWVAKNYGLTLLGATNKINKVTDLGGLTPDILSLAVMTNYLNGDTDPGSNGLNQLVSMAQTQGDGVFWTEGAKLNFGSKDASTALAIRAIVLADGDRDLAVRAARYLTRNRKFEYWSNTFATAQIVRALVDLSKTDRELTPNYSYTIALDGKQIAQGAVSSAKQNIQDVVIPLDKLKSDGSEVTISKNGEGQIYSTLVVNEFHTDRNAKAVNNGLKVEREYVNEKGVGYPLTVGDTAEVKITVSGLSANENYAAIHDELPSGLVPINDLFKNEQYDENRDFYYTSYDITDMDITESGAVLSLYQIESGEHTYVYRTRVVSAGTFITPPVTASLMYAPEIYGRSSAQTVKVQQEANIVFLKVQALKDFLIKYGGDILPFLVIVALGAVGFVVLKKKGIIGKKKSTTPPTTPPTAPPPTVPPPIPPPAQ